nr:MAG TPA: hypothetical protein [Bacteriophage sp.]
MTHSETSSYRWRKRSIEQKAKGTSLSDLYRLRAMSRCGGCGQHRR